MTNQDIFEEDYLEDKRKLEFHKKLSFCIKIFTLGLFDNARNIHKYEMICEKSHKDLEEKNKLLNKAKHLDSIVETIIIDGIRIGKYTFPDISVIGYENYPDNWIQLREIILERDNHECQESGGYCQGPLQIHHIIELSKGGSNNQENLITLCYYHHAEKHEHMKRRLYQ